MKDNLSKVVVGLSLALALLTVGGVAVVGSELTTGEGRPLAELAWFLPVAQSLVVLSALVVSYLCLGRYRALSGTWVFWTGTVFLANAVLGAFYLLAWPGMLGDRGAIAQLSNTSTWLFLLTFSCLPLLLLSLSTDRPASLSTARIATGLGLALLVSALIGLLSVLFERDLPTVAVGLDLTPSALAWIGLLAALTGFAAALAYRRHQVEPGAALGYLALFLVVLTFGLLASFLGGRTYDLWWYAGRVTFILAYVVALFGFLEEGNALLRREREARATSERLLMELEATLEAAPAGVVAYDSSGRIARLNAVAKRIMDLTPAEQGLDMADLVEKLHFEWADGQPIRLEEYPPVRALRGEKVAGVEMAFHRTDERGDRRVWILDGAEPIRASEGAILGAVVSFVEVTELRDLRERQRQLLTELESHAAELVFERDRLSTVIENIVDAIFVCDEAGVITLVNGSARDLLGEHLADGLHTLADFGQALRLRYRGSGQPVPLEDLAIARALRGAVERDREEIAIHPETGKHVDLLVSAAPLLDAQGRIVGAVEVARDVSVFSELDHFKDEFLSVAAHELKTPVATMKGYAQILLRTADVVAPQARRMLEGIDRGANRIDRLVQGLLDISRLQAGGLELTRERFDLAELAGLVLDRSALTAPRHQLRLASVGPVVVEADRGRIEDVLSDLVDNAVRYSPSGGEVEVEVAVDAESVVVSVSDKGVGIPEAKKALIYERFYRAHTNTVHDYGGMGVSLYVAREVIRRHGGETWFTSKENEGSTFCFSLPIAGSESSARPPRVDGPGDE